MTDKTSLSYKDAGVDIDAGNALVERIKGVSKRTRRPEVIGGLGGVHAMAMVKHAHLRSSIGTEINHAHLLAGFYALADTGKMAFERHFVSR